MNLNTIEYYFSCTDHVACVYNVSDSNNGDLSHTNMCSCPSVCPVIKGKAKFRTIVPIVYRSIHNHNAMFEEDVQRRCYMFLLFIVSIDGDIRSCHSFYKFFSLSLSFHLLVKVHLGMSVVIILLLLRCLFLKTGQVSNIFLGEEFHMFCM